MQEYVTEAIVLDREPSGELDFRVSFLTKKRGKIIAKAKSARKIVSKLSGHLMPGYVADIRLIEKNGLQVVDALKKGMSAMFVSDLYLLNKILAGGEPEEELWDKVNSGGFSWLNTLKILGWDPEFALCSVCAMNKPDAFSITGQEFFCRKCSLNSRQKELLCIGTENPKS